MVVSEAIYNNVRTIEARRIRAALADGYEETPLADTTTESPHCRCTMASTGTTLLRASGSASRNQGSEGSTAVQRVVEARSSTHWRALSPSITMPNIMQRPCVTLRLDRLVKRSMPIETTARICRANNIREPRYT
jgi:hypothetical protein